jgi:predicted ATPase/DNA-binding SARP family transcriptional activator
MAGLKLSFLGPPRIELNGVPVEIQRRKALALLAYLAVTGEPQRRDTLAAWLWPDNDAHSARKALRRDLSALNRTLDGEWLEADRESVGLREGAWLDVAHFQRHLALGVNSEMAGIEHLVEAVGLYRGDFLAGFTLLDSPEFDEWQFFQSETQRQACASAVKRLALHLSEQQRHEAAIPYARRWLALDPLHEPAHRQLMQLYAWSDQQAAALRQYELCCQTLAAELDLLPAPETTALYLQIRDRKIDQKTDRTDTRIQPEAHPHTPRHNLPIQTSSFIGREIELAEIQRLLLHEPDCRLLSLVGPGGIGKTRLALMGAAQMRTAFADGATFVSLAPVGEFSFLLSAIAEALHFTFHGKREPKEQLLDFLRPKHLLLVLDNFEHLLDGVNLLADILHHAPDVALLVTSRERLNVQEEWSYTIQGLPYPTSKDQAGPPLNTFSAVQLFLQRARQAEATFMPSPEEVEDIARICQVVEGMPLALELAAPWVRSLSCRDIGLEIQRSLDFLTSTLRNMPERHRSLSVVFEQSWQRLSAAEQAVLCHLSLFRGGCTREAAEKVTGATLAVLLSLVDKALLRRTNTGRYELHELIRQFAEARLQSDPEAAKEAQTRHRDTFITFLEARTSRIKERRQKEILVEIKADIDNVRLAWRQALADQDAEAVERSAECLFVYYLYGNGYDEGQTEFGRAVLAFAGVDEPPSAGGWLHMLTLSGQQAHLVGFLLAAQGYFLAHRHDLPAGQRLLEQALALLRCSKPRDGRKEAFALMWLGWVIYFQGRNVEASPYCTESLALCGESADPWGEGWSLLGLGCFMRDGRPAEAEPFFRSALTVCRQSGDQSVLGYTSYNLGSAVRELGHYAQAQQFIDEGVRISEELDTVLGLGYAHLRRGQLEIDQGHYAHAIQSLEQSTIYFQEVGAIHFNSARLYLSVALHLQGDQRRAEQLYMQLLIAFKELDNRPWLARCLSSAGHLAYEQGEFQQAEAYLLEALAMWQAMTGQEAGMASTLRHLGHMLVAAGEHRHAEAGQYFRQSLELATEQQLAPIALDVCIGVARLWVRSQAMAQAVELLTLVEQHEASTFATRETARHFLAELMNQGATDAVQASQAKGQTGELWPTVEGLVAGLGAKAIPASSA